MGECVKLGNPTAEEIWAKRYQKNGETFEESLKRVAGFLAQGDEEKKQRFFDVMAKGQFYPAGRTMSNSGIGDCLTLSNCFTLNSVPDSMDGIFETVKTGAITHKAGGGTGYDFSSIRPKGSQTNNDAVASGPVSFMQVFNIATETIMAGSRRGANLSALCVYHPDIEEYVMAKSDPDRPDVLERFNMSVMIDDAFMKAVEEDKKIWLHYPVYDENFHIETNPEKWQQSKEISARDLWDKIMERAYMSGEPGVLFYDTMNRDNNVRYCETVITTNPCAI